MSKLDNTSAAKNFFPDLRGIEMILRILQEATDSKTITQSEAFKPLKVLFLWLVKNMIGYPSKIFLYSLKVSIVDSNSRSVIVYHL
jgi:hypothetical protein